MDKEVSHGERYSATESQYIKEKIKGASWSRDRRHIDDLLSLEGFVKNGPKSMAGSYMYAELRAKYKSEYLRLMKEFKPDVLERHLKEEKEANERFQRESEAWKKEAEEQEKRLYGEWLRMGGKE